MQFLVGELAKLSPSLKSSVLFKRCQENYQAMREPTVINMFSNLRQLDVECAMLPEQFSDVPFLDLCPLLQELNFMAMHANNSQEKDRAFDEKQVKKKSVKIHRELKKVTFRGFSGTTSEIKIALYIVRSAVALKEMHISCYYRYYRGNFCWANRELPWDTCKIKRMHQLFQRHAISKTAKITLTLGVPRSN